MPTPKPAKTAPAKTAPIRKAVAGKAAATKGGAPKPPVPKPPAKVGLPTQLAAIQARYRRAMAAVYDRPDWEQAGLIREAIRTMLDEKAALGVKDGEEAAVTVE